MDHFEILKQYIYENEGRGNVSIQRAIGSLHAITKMYCDSNYMKEEYEEAIKLIPECKLHGDTCIPHAKEWIEQAKLIMRIQAQGHCIFHGDISDPEFSDFVAAITQEQVRQKG